MFFRDRFISSYLTPSWRRPLSYRNQSTDLLCKSMDWFLYDNGLCHERVKSFQVIASFFYPFTLLLFREHKKGYIEIKWVEYLNINKYLAKVTNVKWKSEKCWFLTHSTILVKERCMMIYNILGLWLILSSYGMTSNFWSFLQWSWIFANC